MRRVFASVGSDLEVEVLTELAQSRMLNLVGLLAWKRGVVDSATENKSNIRVVYSEDLLGLVSNARWPADTGNHIGVDTLSSYKEYESNFLGMMDRVDTKKNLSYMQRRYAFWFLVNFWSEFLKNSNTDLVYFNSVPHEMVDYILFAVCEVTGVETAMWLDGASIGGKRLERSWKKPWDSFDVGALTINHEMTLNTSRTIRQAQGSYKIAEPASSVIYKKEMASQSRLSLFSLASRSLDTLRASIGLVVKKANKNRKDLAMDFGLNGLQLAFMQMFTIISDLLDSVRVYLDSWLSKRYFSRVSGSHLPNGRFVAFFLHYQPEMTVNPLGDISGDQLIALASLSRAIPSDWEIVIKEHPIQFHRQASGYYTGRDKYFYQRILSLGNTRIVSGQIDTFDMIDKSEVVSTVTGTAAWEAVCRNKPAIIFGNVWFGGAPGVFRIKNELQLHSAIQAITAGEVAIDEKELKYFVESEAKKYVRISFSELLANLEGSDWDSDSSKYALKEQLLLFLYPESRQVDTL